MSASSPPPAANRSRVYSVVLAMVVAALVVAALVLAYLAVQPPPKVNVPAHAVATVGSGTLLVDLPLWAWYTPAPLSLKGFTSSMNLSTFSYHQGPYTHITFRWGNVTGTGESVRFVLESSADGSGTGASIQPGTNDSFEYLPAGVCGEGCDRTGIVTATSGPNQLQDLEFAPLRMNYTVFRMAETNNSVDRSWLQVNYTFAPFGIYGGITLPAANVTLPGPGDLIPVSEPTTYNFTRKDAWSIAVSVKDFVQPMGGFHNRLPAMSFGAGTPAAFNATLTSDFRWDASCDSWVGIGADQGQPFTIQWFFDARFGTLVGQYS